MVELTAERIYARWLAAGTWLALAVLTGTFFAYMAQLAEPLVPLERLPELWRLPAREFVAATGAPQGWGWLAHVSRGDYANLAGVALLCLVTVACYLRVLPALERRAAILALLQVAVLLAAAAGGFAAGH